jgi:hypothetical protein
MEASTWKRELCGWRRGGLLFLAVAPVSVVHGLQLLELIRGKDSRELLFGGLVDRLYLLVHVLRGEGGVSVEGGELLVAICQDGLDLGLLVRREIELPGKSLRLVLWIRRVMVVVCRGGCRLLRIGRRRCLGLLSEGD